MVKQARWKPSTLAVPAFAVLLLAALLLLPVAARWYNVQAPRHAIRHPPVLRPVVPLDRYESAQQAEGFSRWLHGLTYAASGWMGYDDLGRSLVCRVVTAFFISLFIGIGAALLAVLIGTAWGALAALAGGMTDRLMMRMVDMLYGLPYVLMVILLRVGLSGPLRSLAGSLDWLADVMLVFIAIGAVGWLTTARIIRGQVMSLRERGFVEAARLSGASHLYVLRKHLMPHLWGPLMVCATIVIPQAILQESFLSFLGIGVRPPLPSLGRLTAEGVFAVNQYVGFWWQLVFPCGTLILMLLLLAYVGDRAKTVSGWNRSAERAGRSLTNGRRDARAV